VHTAHTHHTRTDLRVSCILGSFFISDLSILGFFPSFKSQKFNPYAILELQFRVHVYNFGVWVV
jgi:hypothetical protein